MKMIRVVVVVVSVGWLLPAGGALAGALDRGPMQQRYNPAAENMMRVPGVVGSYEEEALSMLQQAGLAVTIKRITKNMPRYRGKEGQVVAQTPSAGGVAMIGSTVVITVYKGGGARQDGGQGNGWDNGGWGGGSDAGWTPPPPAPEEDAAGGESAPSDDSGFKGDFSHDVPGVPGPVKGFPAGGSRPSAGSAPSLPGRLPGKPSLPGKDGGKPGAIVGHPVGTATTPSGSGSGKPGLTPEQQRELRKAADRARQGGVKPGSLKPGGKKGSGKPGVIVGHRVGTTTAAGGTGGGKKPALTPEQKHGLDKAADKIQQGGGKPGKQGTVVAHPVGTATLHEGQGSGSRPSVAPSPVGRPAAPKGGALDDARRQMEEKVEDKKPESRSWLDRLLGR